MNGEAGPIGLSKYANDKGGAESSFYVKAEVDAIVAHFVAVAKTMIPPKDARETEEK